MLQQKTVTVSGDEYILTQFPATKGLKYQKKLGRVIIPAIAQITNAKTDEEAMSIGLSVLAENLDELDENLIKEIIVTGSTKGSMTIDFDNEFAGNYLKLFNLFKEIFMYNFGSVFTLLGSDE